MHKLCCNIASRLDHLQILFSIMKSFYRLTSLSVIALITLLCHSVVAAPKMINGDYRDGLDSGELGLEIQGEQYRHTSEGGEGPWRSIKALTYIKNGVVLDEKQHTWCLTAQMPRTQDMNRRAICTKNGWVTGDRRIAANRKLLFSCTTDNDKQILLHDSGKTIDYAFGKPNETPELSLKIPRSQASTWQWRGFGRWMSYSIDVPNGDTTYRVHWGLDRLSSDHTIESGVNVLVNQQIVAEVQCSGNILNDMAGVNLKPRK
jgi:hypothetical protein